MTWKSFKEVMADMDELAAIVDNLKAENKDLQERLKTWEPKPTPKHIRQGKPKP